MTKEFTLPDGVVIKVNSSLFTCPELLFDPSINHKEVDSL